MGLILTRWRKKPSTREELEKIQNDIKAIDSYKRDTMAWQKKVIGYLLAYFSVLYLIAAAIAYFRYFYHPDWQSLGSQFVLWVPFLIAPIILWIVRQILTWWYHRKIRKNETDLSRLIKKKADILNEVMDKETYKAAKEILETFAPEKLLPKVTLSKTTTSQLQKPTTKTTNKPQKLLTSLPRSSEGTSELRRRTNIQSPQGSSAPSNMKIPSSDSKDLSRPSLAVTPRQTPIGPGTSRSNLGNESFGPRTPNYENRPPGPPLPRPILQRERGYMDKMVEYLVGDGPSNRYALICKQCQSHNGMALKEEFEYIAYRCCYCFYWNPARKQRPTAPKLNLSMVRQSSTESSEDEPHESPKATKSKPTESTDIARKPKFTNIENSESKQNLDSKTPIDAKNEEKKPAANINDQPDDSENSSNKAETDK